jgi:hypothetical protein
MAMAMTQGEVAVMSDGGARISNDVLSQGFPSGRYI